MEGQGTRDSQYSLVVRNSNFGLPTACPVCLPIYVYLKLSGFPFRLEFKSNYPDSDEIPYIDRGTYVAFNNDTGGVIQRLKEDGIVDLDAELSSFPEWISLKAMMTSWLEDAILYELWVGVDSNSAWKIYYSDLPWVIGKVLLFKQVRSIKQRLRITGENVERMETEIYKKAKIAYGAFSTRIGEEMFVFENRPSSLDALLVAHVLFTVQALPETSALRTCLMEFDNLIRYSERLKTQFLEDNSSSSIPMSHPWTSSQQRRNPSYTSSKPKKKNKREETEEEKESSRKAKDFLIAQMVAILLFLSVMGSGFGLPYVDGIDEVDQNYD